MEFNFISIRRILTLATFFGLGCFSANRLEAVRLNRVKEELTKLEVNGTKHIGSRDYQEDFAKAKYPLQDDATAGFFCICDGHGGDQAAKFVTDNLLKNIDLNTNDMGKALEEAILKTDAEYLNQEMEINKKIKNYDQKQKAGTTLTGVLVWKGTAYLFNVGDSRTCIYDKKGQLMYATKDHTIESEEERIKKAGGINNNGRVAANTGVMIAMARSLGDAGLKKGAVIFGKTFDGYINPKHVIGKLEKDILIAQPDIHEMRLTDVGFIVMGSDGFWCDKLNNATVGELVLNENNAQKLCEHALELNPSGDNVSVTIVKLVWGIKSNEENASKFSFDEKNNHNKEKVKKSKFAEKFNVNLNENIFEMPKNKKEDKEENNENDNGFFGSDEYFKQQEEILKRQEEKFDRYYQSNTNKKFEESNENFDFDLGEDAFDIDKIFGSEKSQKNETDWRDEYEKTQREKEEWWEKVKEQYAKNNNKKNEEKEWSNIANASLPKIAEMTKMELINLRNELEGEDWEKIHSISKEARDELVLKIIYKIQHQDYKKIDKKKN